MRTWQEDLAGFFSGGEKNDHIPRLGVEVEHFILDPAAKTSVPYSGERGVRRILTLLMEHFPEASVLPDEGFFGFQVPDFTVTLEPAAQLEISISPTDSIEHIGQVYRGFRRALDAVLTQFGYTAANTGCQPYSRVDDMEMIPKRRYDLMDAYFQRSGTGGREMMRGTASLQVSIDYCSEEDFRRKVQAAYYYSPFLKLLCDNAPCFQGEKLDGVYLKRTDIWRRVDPARCGILPGVFAGNYGYADYAGFLGNMPPVFLKMGPDILPTGEKTVAELFDGKGMGEEEILHIISMAFPDVRLKHYLEIRVADSVPQSLILAYCALIQGLLYSEEGLAYAGERIRQGGFNEVTLLHAEDALMRRGWDAEIYGKPAVRAVETVLDLARRNLPAGDLGYLDAFAAKKTNSVSASGGEI